MRWLQFWLKYQYNNGLNRARTQGNHQLVDIRETICWRVGIFVKVDAQYCLFAQRLKERLIKKDFVIHCRLNGMSLKTYYFLNKKRHCVWYSRTVSLSFGIVYFTGLFAAKAEGCWVRSFHLWGLGAWGSWTNRKNFRFVHSLTRLTHTGSENRATERQRHQYGRVTNEARSNEGANTGLILNFRILQKKIVAVLL